MKFLQGTGAFLDTTSATDTEKVEGVLKSISSNLTGFLWKLFWGVVVLIIGILVIRAVRRWILSRKAVQKLSAGTQASIRRGLSFLFYTVLILTVASILGVPMSAFVTLLASLGVAISLAVQGVLSNLVAGMVISFTRPFVVGDYIKVDGMVEGTVLEVGGVHTVIASYDNTRLSVPNSSLTNVAIQNFSALPRRRIKMAIRLKQGCDIEAVKRLLTDCCRTTKGCLMDPPPDTYLDALDDGVMTFGVEVWCDRKDYFPTKRALLEQINTRLMQELSLSPAAPQLEVKMKEES